MSSPAVIGTVVRIDNPARSTQGYQVRWKGRPSKLFSVSVYGSWEAAHLAALRTANQVAAVEIRRTLQELQLRVSAGELVSIEAYAERIERLTGELETRPPPPAGGAP